METFTGDPIFRAFQNRSKSKTAKDQLGGEDFSNQLHNSRRDKAHQGEVFNLSQS